jgi:hypothetical protein|tara:strand:+ start:2981 stop:3259 length:279 start_codon:yes stop_codon:yes gene_type:complete
MEENGYALLVDCKIQALAIICKIDKWALETKCVEAHFNKNLDPMAMRAIVAYTGKMMELRSTLETDVNTINDLMTMFYEDEVAEEMKRVEEK